MTGFVDVARNIVRQRSLIVELTKRELKLRYRNSFLGFLWTLVNPLVFMVIYTLVFHYFLGVKGEKFPAFLVSGMLPWTMWLAESVPSGTSCLVDHGAFLRSSVFPSDILPVVAVSTGMMNYVFALPVMFLLLLFFRIDLGWEILALPIIMAVQFLLTLSIVYLTSTLNVFVRDMRYLVQHFLMIAMFMSPVLYDFATLPPRFQRILSLNPLATVVSSYRSIFYYGAWPDWRRLAYVTLFALALLCVSTQVFSRNREVFAEYL